MQIVPNLIAKGSASEAKVSVAKVKIKRRPLDVQQAGVTVAKAKIEIPQVVTNVTDDTD